MNQSPGSFVGTQKARSGNICCFPTSTPRGPKHQMGAARGPSLRDRSPRVQTQCMRALEAAPWVRVGGLLSSVVDMGHFCLCMLCVCGSSCHPPSQHSFPACQAQVSC